MICMRELKNPVDTILEHSVANRYHELEKVISKIANKANLSKYESIEYYNKLLELNDIRFMMKKKMEKE